MMAFAPLDAKTMQEPAKPAGKSSPPSAPKSAAALKPAEAAPPPETTTPSKPEPKSSVLPEPIQASDAAAGTPAKVATARPMALDAPKHGKADDLKLISGVGPKLEVVLNDLGIYHFDQIASWTKSEIGWVDDYLKFSGRIERDDWVAQAKALVAGGVEEYIRVFGKEPR
jgi:NADH-quinone oxidoreductase subunit E